MWIWLFISSFALAQDQSFERYCFGNHRAMEEAAQKLQIALLPGDKVSKEDFCFTVATKPHRMDLIQNFVRRIDPSMQVSLSSDQKSTEPCRLKVEKEKTIQADNSSISALPYPGTQTSTASSVQTETMQIQTLGDFELKYDQDSIKGHCIFINSTRYTVKLQVKRELRPQLIPNVMPPNDQTSFLETTLDLKRGEKIEIGGIVRDLRQEKSQADSKPQIDGDVSEKIANEKVFLSLE